MQVLFDLYLKMLISFMPIRHLLSFEYLYAYILYMCSRSIEMTNQEREKEKENELARECTFTQKYLSESNWYRQNS